MLEEWGEDIPPFISSLCLEMFPMGEVLLSFLLLSLGPGLSCRMQGS